MPSIESAHADVQSAVAEAVQWANAGEARTLWEYETRAWALMLALGRALVVLFLARQMSRPRAVRISAQRDHQDRLNAITRIGDRDHPDRRSRSPGSVNAITLIGDRDHLDR